ncbi:MAG: DUF1007 family protein [Gammaproteobacteria bacterium]|nr:MAG: DUF1007 family protein [Gammaproteobacteria bacterium]
MINRLFFVLFLTIFTPCISFAHPHMFVSYDVTFVVDGSGLTGVRMNWDMDPMFSASLMESFDLNKNRKLEKNEIKKLEKEAFSNLANYHYMTFIRLDGKPSKFQIPENFTAAIVDKEVRYTFTLPIKISAKNGEQKVGVEVYDGSNFIYFSYNEKVDITGAEKNKINHEIKVVKKKVKDQYMEDVTKRIATLIFSKKSN